MVVHVKQLSNLGFLHGYGVVCAIIKTVFVEGDGSSSHVINVIPCDCVSFHKAAAFLLVFFLSEIHSFNHFNPCLVRPHHRGSDGANSLQYILHPSQYGWDFAGKVGNLYFNFMPCYSCWYLHTKTTTLH